MTLKEQARASAKEAFRHMMLAATKTANLFTVLAEQEEDDKKRVEYNEAAARWQQSATTAAMHWRTM